jgi:hypothetical protein
MTATPPTQPLSATTRLLAAVIIALAALGITCLADRWIQDDSGVIIVPLPGAGTY